MITQCHARTSSAAKALRYQLHRPRQFPQYELRINTKQTLPSGTTITYLVDGQDRRVGKRVNGTLVKQWLYRVGLRPVAELDGAGAVVARFVYASDRNTPEFVVRGGSRYRVLTDQLGSPRMAVNVTNATDVPFHAEYTAFGLQTMLDGAADWMPFGFAGGMSDPETGLVRFGARDYDPSHRAVDSKGPVALRCRRDGFLCLWPRRSGEPTGPNGAFLWM